MYHSLALHTSPASTAFVRPRKLQNIQLKHSCPAIQQIPLASAIRSPYFKPFLISVPVAYTSSEMKCMHYQSTAMRTCLQHLIIQYPFTSTLTLQITYPNLHVIYSLSKDFGCSGIKMICLVLILDSALYTSPALTILHPRNRAVSYPHSLLPSSLPLLWQPMPCFPSSQQNLPCPYLRPRSIRPSSLAV